MIVCGNDGLSLLMAASHLCSWVLFFLQCLGCLGALLQQQTAAGASYSTLTVKNRPGRAVQDNSNNDCNSIRNNNNNNNNNNNSNSNNSSYSSSYSMVGYLLLSSEMFLSVCVLLCFYKPFPQSLQKHFLRIHHSIFSPVVLL